MHLILLGLFLYSSIKNGCSNWISIVIQEWEIMETINMWYDMEKRYVQNKESWLTSLFLFNNACQTCYNNTEIRHKNKMNFGYLVLVFTIFFLRGILGMKTIGFFARFSIHLLQKYLLHFELIHTLFLLLLSEAPKNSYCIRI